MAGHTYVTKAYNYNDFPAQEGGYAYGPERQANWYVVETRTVERVRISASGYTKWGAPLEVSYDSDYENSNFPNKLQIGTSPPMKTSNLSSPNKYRPTSPSKYSPKSQNKHQPTSPNKYYPTSPITYSPISPNKYESTSPHKYRPTSPNKYFSKSPGTYRSTSPNKYHPTSPNNPKNSNTHRPTSPDKYFSSIPDKYQATSPTKYRPTSSSYTYPSKETNMKAQNLPRQNKCRPTSPTKYLTTSPTHNYPSKEDHMNWSQDMPVPNKYRSTSPIYRIPSKEGQPQVVDFSSPKNHWQSAGPPTTCHPLTTPTNNINEALGFLMESYSPRSHPTREESFDILSPRAQPTEHERRYARTASGGVTNGPYLRSNTIDSNEAVRRYNGAYV